MLTLSQSVKPLECIMLLSSSQRLVALIGTICLMISCHEVLADRSDRVSEDQARHDIVRNCQSHLEVHKGEKGLTREEFASLVTALSHGELTGPYERLPLPFASIFNMNACLNGKDCIGDHAVISILSQDERTLACSSIASLLNAVYETNATSTTCPVDTVDDMKVTREDVVVVGK